MAPFESVRFGFFFDVVGNGDDGVVWGGLVGLVGPIHSTDSVTGKGEEGREEEGEDDEWEDGEEEAEDAGVGYGMEEHIE